MTIVPLDAERLRLALDALARTDRVVGAQLARIGYPPPRVREPGFATLLKIVTAQQVSTRSAAAIWRKLEAVTGREPSPATFLALDDTILRAAGFSGRKIDYGRGLAAAIVDGALELDALPHLDEERAIETITALRGFGRWSAEIYLLFALGRIDCFPADDLALQVGFQRLHGLAERPPGKILRERVAAWSPWRGAGALFLWHYYGAITLDDVPRS